MNGARALAIAVAGTLPLLLGYPSLHASALPLVVESRARVARPFGLVSSVLTLREKGALMVRIPGSSAWLGSTASEALNAAAQCAQEPLAQRCNEQTFANELERRRVDVPAFFIDRNEVSVGEYARCVAAGYCQPPAFAAGAQRFNRRELPVSFVSYEDAVAYCRFRGARLPREAEFERAARGSEGRAYPWGELYNAHVLNHGRLGVLENDASDGYAELAPVGSFPDGKSPEGVLDLSGNVAEWQAEPYRESSNDPVPDDTESAPRVVRGGSYLRGAAFVRGAARERADTKSRRPDIGLRCARSAQHSAP
ncbi:MAG: formylglycine-generating enzyme family protein [Myxococcota bacterium]